MMPELIWQENRMAGMVHLLEIELNNNDFIQVPALTGVS
jgi:hypothetical protein